MIEPMKLRLEATLKALRRQKGWSQARLGQALGASQQRVSRLEADVRRTPLGLLEAWAIELGAYLAVDLRISGERPLSDANHAALQNRLAAQLRRAGWLVATETSFNHYGDRGRVDLLAFYPALRILLVVEIKTRIQDVQDMLGRLDVKKRIAPMLARDRGWDAAAIVPAFVVREDRTARRRVAKHAALFTNFGLRARAARAWLGHPWLPPPQGILLFEDLHSAKYSPGM
jgi:transcriptional regulator with XRE-family HTH domain